MVPASGRTVVDGGPLLDGPHVMALATVHHGEIVGAYAPAHVGRPRATDDLDAWVDATPDNAFRVMSALAAFGAPLHDMTQEDFSRPGVVFQIGVPPGRIDILTELTGLTFAEAWTTREPGQFGDAAVDFIGRDALVRNKRGTGRAKDLGDIEGL